MKTAVLPEWSIILKHNLSFLLLHEFIKVLKSPKTSGKNRRLGLFIVSTYVERLVSLRSLVKSEVRVSLIGATSNDCICLSKIQWTVRQLPTLNQRLGSGCHCDNDYLKLEKV